MGGAELLHPAVFHHRNAVAQCHGLDLVVRDIHRGGLGALVQELDFGAHFHAQLGVQVGQRFVKQKQLGVARQSTAHGHPLTLAARELTRLAVQQMTDLQHGRDTRHCLFSHRFGHLANLQTKGDVFGHRHVGVQRVALKHHGNVTVLAGQVGHIALTNVNAAAGRLVQSRDHRQQGRFTAAGGSDQDQELPGFDFYVDAFENVNRLVVGFMNVANGECAHDVSL